MPDIVSRIKVEAQGADQAAREIRKLKEAYDQVGAAARDLSPGRVGGGDPFSKATQPNTGVMAGGQTNADVAERETRNRRYEEQTRERERSNQQYNGAIRPNQIGAGFQTAEAAASNRGGAAIGGGANMLGGMLGGPVGMALMGIGAAAFGIQKLADQSQQRMENVFGGGISQRLGSTYAPTQNYMTGLARTGVPMGMVQGLMQSASASGAQLNEETVGQFSMMADIAAGSGVDPGTLGALLGAQQRSGVSATYGVLSRGAGTFGRGNLGTFFTELTRTLETSMQRGIKLSQEEMSIRGNVIAGMATNLSPTGAVAMNQTMTQRAQQAGTLQRPEDIIAFQAMRGEGASIAETIRAMEESPTEVNERVFEYLQRATGGNEDEMFLRVRQYLGGNASAAQVNEFISSRGGAKYAEGEGIPTAGIYGREFVRDEEGNFVLDEEGNRVTRPVDEARDTMARLQINALKGVQDAMLEVTSSLAGLGAWVTGADITTKATDVGFGGTRNDRLQEARDAARATIEEVDEITAQDVSNLNAEIDEANLNVRQTERVDDFIADPRFATNASTIRSLRENEGLQRQIDEVFSSTPGWGGSWERLKEGGFESFGGGVGGFEDLFTQIISAVTAQAESEATEGLGLLDFGAKSRERREIREVIQPIMEEFFGPNGQLSRNITTDEQLSAAIRELVTALGEAGIVFTDGGMEIPTR